MTRVSRSRFDLSSVPSLGRPFLTAEWRHLAMASWRCDPALVEPYVPHGTVLDLFDGAALVSLVGFMFTDTRVLGAPVPGHRDFEELNLRFYVRREVPRAAGEPEVRRAVSFVKEIVPLTAVAVVARWAYNEPYESRPMRHELRVDEAGNLASVEYAWRQRQLPGGWGRFALEVSGMPRQAMAGSEAQFVTEHYWGYTRQRDGSTVEYQVQHPPWRVWTADRVMLEADAEELYGRAFADVMDGKPSSAFLAEGSEVSVSTPVHL